MAKKDKSLKDWKRIVSDYHERDCTQGEFCKARDLKPATLQKYIKLFHKHEVPFTPMPIALATQMKEVVICSRRYVI